MNEKHHLFIRKYLPLAGVILLALSGAILLFFVIFRLQVIGDFVDKLLGILAPILYGVVLAYLISPICNGIERGLLSLLRKYRVRRAASASKKSDPQKEAAQGGFLTHFFHLRKYQTASASKTSDSPKKAALGGFLARFFHKEKKSGAAESFASGLAIAISLLLVLLAVYGLIALVVPQVVSSIRSIVDAMPSYLQTAENWMIQFLNDNPEMARTVQQATDSAINWFQNWLKTELLPNFNNIVYGVSSGVMGVVNVLKNLVIGIIVTVYLLASRKTFASQAKKIVYSLLPVGYANSFVSHTRYAHSVFGGFISGKILDSLIIGIICFIGTSFMKIPYSMLVSVIIGITNIIPFFGPFIGAVPCGLLILLADPLRCLYFVLFIIVLQQFDGNILGPKILGDSTGLSSFWVLFSILLFGGLLGFLGMVIGVPAFAVIYNLITQFINRRLEKKDLSTETELYNNLDHIDEINLGYVKKTLRDGSLSNSDGDL